MNEVSRSEEAKLEMDAIGSVCNLEVWKEAVALAKTMYELTARWPKEELYGLTSQLRRAAVSVPANLAEGIGRKTPAEAGRFAQIAVGSVYELDTLLHIATELNHLRSDGISELRQRYRALARRLSRFVQYQNRRGAKR